MQGYGSDSWPCGGCSALIRWFPLVDQQGSSSPSHFLTSCSPPSQSLFFQVQSFIHLLWALPSTFSFCSLSDSCHMFSLSSPLLVPHVPLNSVLIITITFNDTDSLYQKHLGTSLVSPPYLYSPNLQKLSNVSAILFWKPTLSPDLPFPLYSNSCKRSQNRNLFGLW